MSILEKSDKLLIIILLLPINDAYSNVDTAALSARHAERYGTAFDAALEGPRGFVAGGLNSVVFSGNDPILVNIARAPGSPGSKVFTQGKQIETLLNESRLRRW
jgi:hypothetical protein